MKSTLFIIISVAFAFLGYGQNENHYSGDSSCTATQKNTQPSYLNHGYGTYLNINKKNKDIEQAKSLLKSSENATKKIDSAYRFYFDEVEENWQLYSRNFFIYDFENRSVEKVNKYEENFYHPLDYCDVTKYTFNENGLLSVLEYGDRYIDSINNLTINNRIEHKYTDNNLIKSKKSYYVNSNIKIMTLSEEYSYEPNGKLKTYSIKTWGFGYYTFSSIYTYKYEYISNINCLKTTEYFNEENSRSDEKKSITEAYRDNSGKDTLIKFYEKHWKSYDMILRNIIRYTYNQNGKKIEEIINQSYWGEEDMEPLSKKKYSYDNNGNIVRMFYYEWDATNEKWLLTYDTKFSYDTVSVDNLLYNVFWREEEEYAIETENIEISEQLDVNREEIPYLYYSSHTDYFYSDSSSPTEMTLQDFIVDIDTVPPFNQFTETGVKNTELKENVKLYPNPASNFIIITLPEGENEVRLMLYDQEGRVVLNSNITNNQITDIRSLKPGIYYYNLSTQKTNSSGVVLINR